MIVLCIKQQNNNKTTMIKNVEKAINDLGIVCDPVDCVSIHDVVKIVKYLDKNGLITH